MKTFSGYGSFFGRLYRGKGSEEKERELQLPPLTSVHFKYFTLGLRTESVVSSLLHKSENTSPVE